MANEVQIPVELIYKGEDDVRRLNADLKGTSAALGGVDTSSNSSALAMGALGGIVGGVLLDGLGQAAGYAKDLAIEMVDLGSDSRETASLLNNALGPAAESFNAQIAEIAENTRRSSFELTQGTSSIIAMTRSMGQGQAEAADFGASVAQVGADFSSYFNVEQTQFFDDFQSALAGSSETMQKYGIDVSVTALETAAFNMGLIEQGDKLDKVTRSQVLLAEVQRQGGDAFNDAAETAEGYANSMKGLEAIATDTKAAIGEVLAEGLEPAANAMYELATGAQPAVIEGFSDLIATTKDYALVIGTVGGDVAILADAFLSLNLASIGVSETAQNAIFTWENAANVLSGGLYSSFVVANDAIGEQADLLRDAESATKQFSGPNNELAQIAQGAADAMDAQTNSTADLVTTNSELSDATTHIASVIYDEELAFKGAQLATELHAKSLEADAEASLAAAKAAEEAARKRIQAEGEAFKQSGSLYENLAAAQQQLADSQGEYVQVYSDSADDIAAVSSQLAGDLNADQKKAYSEILGTVAEGSEEWLGAYQALQNDLTDAQRAALIAQQAELQNTEGGWQTVYTGDQRAAEEAQAAIEAANAAIAESYRTAAFEATVSQNGFNESTAQLAVNLGILTEEQAAARLEFTNTTVAIGELTSTTGYLNASVNDQTEAIQLLSLGYAASAEEALALAGEINGPFAESIRTSSTLTQEQINLLDELNGKNVTSTVTVNTVNTGGRQQYLPETANGRSLSEGGSGGGGTSIQTVNVYANESGQDLEAAVRQLG